MLRKGEQGITKRHKRKYEHAREYLCSMLMDLMGLLTVTDNVPPHLAYSCSLLK